MQDLIYEYSKYSQSFTSFTSVLFSENSEKEPVAVHWTFRGEGVRIWTLVWGILGRNQGYAKINYMKRTRKGEYAHLVQKKKTKKKNR